MSSAEMPSGESGRADDGDPLPAAWEGILERLSRRVASAAEITLDLTTRPSLRRVRSTVAECLAFGSADGETLGPLLLVVDELVGNAYQHGSRPLELRITRHVRSLMIEVSDADPHVARVRAGPAGVGKGNGLRLVAHLALDWGVKADGPGKLVWALVPSQLCYEL